MNLLFVCVSNSARSQIAEGFAKSLSDNWTVQSAGSWPTIINPMAIQVMNEVGVDISRQRPKPLQSIDLDRIDCAVILSEEEHFAGEIKGLRKIFFPIDSPSRIGGSYEVRLESFRRARERIRHLVTELHDSFVSSGRVEISQSLAETVSL